MALDLRQFRPAEFQSSNGFGQTALDRARAAGYSDYQIRQSAALSGLVIGDQAARSLDVNPGQTLSAMPESVTRGYGGQGGFSNSVPVMLRYGQQADGGGNYLFAASGNPGVANFEDQIRNWWSDAKKVSGRDAPGFNTDGTYGQDAPQYASDQRGQFHSSATQASADKYMAANKASFNGSAETTQGGSQTNSSGSSGGMGFSNNKKKLTNSNVLSAGTGLNIAG